VKIRRDGEVSRDIGFPSADRSPKWKTTRVKGKREIARVRDYGIHVLNVYFHC
jgi:hypothetical protein